MRSDGTPVMIMGDASAALSRERIGGRDGRHNERWLQTLIHRHPTCLPMDQIEPGFSRMVPVCMELPLSCGYLDNLLISPEGDIVIVEAKLWRNPEARREVVAQALDYANSLFGMDYAALEQAVLRADFDSGEKPARLYDLFDDADTLEEPDFVDAVTMNLRNGRIVVLVVGDGIRTGAETLIDGLKSHAGFHFTFALVELAVFRSRREDDLIVVPRTLLKTSMIERGIVRIDDRRSEVVPLQATSKAKSAGMALSITSEQFFEAMGKRDANLPDTLKGFIGAMSDLDVYPEFKKSLIFRWDATPERTVTLGYIKKSGQVWTDLAGWKGCDPSILGAYRNDLADCFGGEVVTREKGSMYVAINDKAPHIETLTEKLDCWLKVVERFQQRVREYLAEQDVGDE